VKALPRHSPGETEENVTEEIDISLYSNTDTVSNVIENLSIKVLLFWYKGKLEII
jgi:hypothetical protein